MFQPHRAIQTKPEHDLHASAQAKQREAILKVSELEGDSLDTAVAELIGGSPIQNFQPSRKWGHGGPLIDTFRINVAAIWAWHADRGDFPTGKWQGIRKMKRPSDPFVICTGNTALEAAMRVLVATDAKADAAGVPEDVE